MSMAVIAMLAALADPGGTTPPPPATPPAQSVAAAPAASKGSRIICRQSEETGTRLGGSRVCMSADAWRRQDEDLREELTRVKGFQPH